MRVSRAANLPGRSSLDADAPPALPPSSHPSASPRRELRILVRAIVPAHDEEATIADVVGGLIPLCASVLVVDDGSSDGTARCALDAGAELLSLPRRRGKGHAIRAGIARTLTNSASDARADGVLLVDGDGQHGIEDVRRVLAIGRNGAPFVIGDRSHEYSRMSRVRAWTNRCMSLALQPVVGPGVPDTQCGLRYLQVSLLERLSLSCEHFDIESEMLAATHALGVPPVVVPISVLERAGSGRSKISPVTDGLRFARLLARLSLSRIRPDHGRRHRGRDDRRSPEGRSS